MRSPHTSTAGEERVHSANQVSCAHHTPATGGRRRESHRGPIKCMRFTTQPATGGEERGHKSQSSVCASHTPATGEEER